MIDEITYICNKFEKRGPGSKGEKQACDYAAKQMKEYGCAPSEETIAIVSLLHDICNTGIKMILAAMLQDPQTLVIDPTQEGLRVRSCEDGFVGMLARKPTDEENSHRGVVCG